MKIQNSNPNTGKNKDIPRNGPETHHFILTNVSKQLSRHNFDSNEVSIEPFEWAVLNSTPLLKQVRACSGISIFGAEKFGRGGFEDCSIKNFFTCRDSCSFGAQKVLTRGFSAWSRTWYG